MDFKSIKVVLASPARLARPRHDTALDSRHTQARIIFYPSSSTIPFHQATQKSRSEMADDYIFGYGSILDDFDPGDDVYLCDLSPESTYQRSWCFRSKTGFTAVGVLPRSSSSSSSSSNNNNNNNNNSIKDHSICGVLFRLGTTQSSKDKDDDTNQTDFIATSTSSLEALDKREAGYNRVRIQANHLTTAPESSQRPVPSFAPNARMWMYVPVLAEAADKDSPICQTYVDTVLRGCFKWGGETLARRWILSTSGWSQYYLNDAPMSRRPWLHRKRYDEIDALLESEGMTTLFSERRHPEEFSAHWLSMLRGFWGVPPRNVQFIGRERELEKIMEVCVVMLVSFLFSFVADTYIFF